MTLLSLLLAKDGPYCLIWLNYPCGNVPSASVTRRSVLSSLDFKTTEPCLVIFFWRTNWIASQDWPGPWKPRSFRVPSGCNDQYRVFPGRQRKANNSLWLSSLGIGPACLRHEPCYKFRTPAPICWKEVRLGIRCSQSVRHFVKRERNHEPAVPAIRDRSSSYCDLLGTVQDQQPAQEESSQHPTNLRRRTRQ